MGYAVELTLEKSAAEPIRRLFDLTESLMARIGALPHVSLAVFDSVDSSKLIDVVRLFAENTSPLGIRFSSIGIFPGADNVVFLAPLITNDLLALHKSFHDRLHAAGLTSHPYYLPEAWVPHCTITMEEQLPQTLETIRLIHRENVLVEYPVSHINVIEFRPVVILASFNLTGRRPKESHMA